MTTTTNTTFSYEDETYTIEGTISVPLYYEAADPSVGIMYGGFTVDGEPEIEELSICYYADPEQTDESFVEWESKDPKAIAAALSFLAIGEPTTAEALETFLEKQAEEAAGDYDPRDDYEPDYDECASYRWRRRF